MESNGHEGESAEIRTFLIADVRGYTRFTGEHGDEAAARLTAKLAAVTRDAVRTRGGEALEPHGDEVLAVFASARQALRAALELQARFAEETEAEPELPLRVGIGIDSGEAVRTEDGFRGGALNMASRLCGLARAGEVIVSESVVHLAGRIDGVNYVDRGRAHLKGIPEAVRIHQVLSETAVLATRRPVQLLVRPKLTWKLVALVCLVAAATASAVVLLTTGGPSGSAATKSGGSSPQAPPASTGSMSEGAMEHGEETEAPTGVTERLSSYAEGRPWTCRVAVSPAGAEARLLCSTDVPHRLELILYSSRKALDGAYAAEMRRHGVRTASGACTANSWRGEIEWSHGAGAVAGRAFCDVSVKEGDSHITWTSRTRDGWLLLTAHLEGLRHRELFFWWRNIRHDLV